MIKHYVLNHSLVSSLEYDISQFILKHGERITMTHYDEKGDWDGETILPVKKDGIYDKIQVTVSDSIIREKGNEINRILTFFTNHLLSREICNKKMIYVCSNDKVEIADNHIKIRRFWSDQREMGHTLIKANAQ